MRGSSNQALADRLARPDHQVEDALQAVAVEHAVADLLHGDGGQRRLRRRPPQHAIAAHRRDHGVPGPHRDREIEGADHAHDAERMPLLVHAMAGPLAVHGEAVELAREADGEIGDVDHLLHFAQAFGAGSCPFRATPARPDPVLWARSSLPISRTISPRLGRGHHAPFEEGLGGARHHGFVIRRHRPCCTRASGSPVAGQKETSSPPDGFGDPIAVTGAGIHGLDVEFLENIGNNQVRGSHTLHFSAGTGAG